MSKTPREELAGPSMKPREPAGPMTLANMRSLGPRSLDVMCRACGHHTSVNVDAYADDVAVPSLGPRMRCRKCGHLGANVRPDWSQLSGVPSR